MTIRPSAAARWSSNSNGEVDVEAGHTGTGATLKGVDVVNSGLIQVEEGAVLDLEGDTIAGGTLNTIGYPPSYGQDGGVIEVLAKGGTTTFDGSASKVTVEGYVQVAAGAELELKGRIDLDSADNLGIIELDQTQSPDAKGSTLEISRRGHAQRQRLYRARRQQDVHRRGAERRHADQQEQYFRRRQYRP